MLLTNVLYEITTEEMLSLFTTLIICAISILLEFILVQWITADRLPFRLPLRKQLANVICYTLIIDAVYILFARMEWASLLSGTMILLLATSNYYVYRFKGTELALTDLFAIGTAKNVSMHYNYMPERRVVFAWMVWIAYSIFQLYLRQPIMFSSWLIRAVALLIEVLLIIVFLVFTKHVRGTHWANEGSLNYGYLLNFMIGSKALLELKPPKGYKSEIIDTIFRNDISSNQKREQKPDIIVIMNESFADLGVLGRKPETNVPVLNYFKSLRENTIHGYALSSVFGGTTANSEYEFLTGNSMAFFPYGSIPYMQFIHGETYSLVSELKQEGYLCVATHPYLDTGWSRPTVYQDFGFEQITFEESYPKKDLLRGYISDDEMYDYVTKQYDRLSKAGNVFLFGVTVQNHGGYVNRREMLENTVYLRDKSGEYPDVDQYLTLLQRSDQAIEKLIYYFSNVKRDVVLCFFGDHLPSLSPDFMQELHGGRYETLDEQQKTKMVPFFIWANYPLEQQYIGCTSLNYLATHILEAAGIELPPFRRFLKKLEKTVPSINADGYYSNNQNHFCQIDKAEGIEEELLKEYRMMVYNNAIDKKHRNKEGFPVI